MNCEHHSSDEPFPGIFLLKFILDKNNLFVCFSKMYGRIHPRDCSHKFKKMKVNTSNDSLKFERSLNDLFCVCAADILNFIVCANKKAILPQFHDEMIRFQSRCLTRNKVI